MSPMDILNTLGNRIYHQPYCHSFFILTLPGDRPVWSGMDLKDKAVDFIRS